MRSSIPFDKRQFGGAGLTDCFTTCMTNAMLAGQCGGLAVDYNCMCTDASYKKDRDTCLTKNCSGSAQLQNAQTTWDYFCVYINSGSFTGLPTGATGGLTIPTSLFNTATSKATSTPTSTGNNTTNGNSNANNLGDPNGGDTSKEKSTPMGAIIGGAVGGLALILMLVFLILHFRRRRTPSQSEKYPQGPPATTFPPPQFVPPQPSMAHMSIAPVMNPSMAGGVSPNPSFNSANPFMNHGQGYAASANSFVSGQASYNNTQPAMSYPTQSSHLPSGAGMGVPMSPQGQVYPEHTGSTNVGSPFLSPTSAHSHSFNSHPSMPPTSPSSSSIPTSDHSRLTVFSTNSQQHLLGMTSYSNMSPNTAPSSPPSTGSSPSQQAAAQLTEKQRLQIHLEYQDGAATAGSGSSAAGGSVGFPSSGFHVTNSHQQDGLDSRSVVYSTTTTSGTGSKGGAYNVTNPTTDGTDAPPVYSEQSR